MSKGLIEELAAWSLAATLVTAASMYGAVEAGARAWLLFAAIGCFAASWWHATIRDVTRPMLAVAIPGLAIAAWVFAQTLPLPRPVLALVAPKAASLYHDTVPEGGGRALPGFIVARVVSGGAKLREGATLPAGTEDSAPQGVGRTLSISPTDTREACLTWLTPTLLFLASALTARDHRRRSLLLWSIAGWGGVLGACAIVQAITHVDVFLIARGVQHDARPIGPFINPNHFATYAGISALVATSLLLAHASGSASSLSLRSVREALLDRGWALPRILTLAVLATLALTGLAISRSRGGWLAVAAGFIVLAAGRRRTGILAGAIVAVLIVGVAVGLASWIGFGGGAAMAPFSVYRVDASVAERLDAWAKCITVFTDHPWTGTGAGTFEWAFASYQRPGEWMVWRQAHNDYLQFLAETGVVGAVLLAAGVASFLRRVLVPALRLSRSGPRWTTLGAAAAIVATAVHAIVEFSLQMPAIAALVATLLGVLAAAAADGPEEITS